ncbi:hypothetical protein KIPB_011477 [Kipferlia bialata]|uniref:Origin recognition complex subunit 1 n=1 Tax=Kipferlia bialata TaxID=797122 RepID=A0A9K3D5P7_9EUKA|nr:hypothetical protein KIPB_011477 [Kipferlia bialata]|eukprot:g11477.t1
MARTRGAPKTGAGRQRDSDTVCSGNELQCFRGLLHRCCRSLELSSVPEVVAGRADEVAFLTQFLCEKLSKRQSGSLYISGVPGTGKTLAVSKVLEYLENESGQDPFNVVIVNGGVLSTPKRVFTAIWSGLSGKKTTPEKALELLDRRFGTLSKDRQCDVLVVDELDRLVTRDCAVLYSLFDWTSQPGGPILVGVANTLTLLDDTIPRVASRAGLARLPFSPYNNHTLFNVLVARTQAYLVDNTPLFSQEALKLCSRRVSNISGDARRALHVLKAAICLREAAVLGGSSQSTVSTGDITQAFKSCDSGVVGAVRMCASTEVVALIALYVCVRVSQGQRQEERSGANVSMSGCLPLFCRYAKASGLDSQWNIEHSWSCLVTAYTSLHSVGLVTLSCLPPTLSTKLTPSDLLAWEDIEFVVGEDWTWGPDVLRVVNLEIADTDKSE